VVAGLTSRDQFFNAIYVLNGDASDKAAIYIYDAANAAWSKQAVTTGAFDPTNFQTILDHDTNVFCMRFYLSRA
jgi:hypothetical protein